MQGKTQVAEDVDDSFDVDVIKESGDVEKDDRCDEVALDGSLGMVYEAKRCIGCAMIVA